jgi:adenine-specific DNA methylase
MTPHPVHRRKKLIEVAIPFEAINAASALEKSIRHGHPTTLHLWWARRPLAAARAVILCQIVDDPSAVPEEYKLQKSAGKQVRLPAQVAKERYELLMARLEKRKAQLALEAQISAKAPILKGGTLVIPVGLLLEASGAVEEAGPMQPPASRWSCWR